MPEPTNTISDASPPSPSGCCGCCACLAFCCKKQSNNSQEIMENNGTEHRTVNESEDDNSKIPFYGVLPRNLSAGKNISVTGTILPNCSRFAVNLTCGKSPSSDIAFHFNPRLQLHYVVRNSRFGGKWGEEETASPIKFNIDLDRPDFKINIFLCEEQFLVCWNGVFVCSYAYRVSLAKLVGMHVEGGQLRIHSVEYFDQQRFPDLEDFPQNRLFQITSTPPGNVYESESSTTSLDIPVTVLLPQGFQRDWQLEIYGRVKILPHSFHINLQEGSQQWPHPTIQLHLNPRFGAGSGKGLFIRNAWIEGGWGQEERTPGFQFSPGSAFTMAIRRGSDHFSVWIDGKLAGEFKFRGDVNKIDTLYIQGDLLVYKIVLCDSPR